MPSFDITSEIDAHELTNAVDQANREVSQRFDFKNTGAKFEQDNDSIKLTAQNDFQIKQMEEILKTKMSKREIDVRALKPGEIETALHEARLNVNLQQGINKEFAKKIIKLVKDSKLKVQTAIQGEQVRVTGKKRDDLQEVIALLREAKLELPLQFVNFRD